MGIQWIDINKELPKMTKNNESDVVVVWTGDTWWDAYYCYDFNDWSFCHGETYSNVSEDEITHFAYINGPNK